jgi:hypothetical protein
MPLFMLAQPPSKMAGQAISEIDRSCAKALEPADLHMSI